jgi:crossover junction endodeoxyribonuclease RuvC
MQKTEEKNRIILGIDPGTRVLGYGLIQIEKKNAKLLYYGIAQVEKFEDHYKRLQYLYERVVQIIREYKPDDLAIEAPFYGKNIQSMLKLGRAQGVIMAAAMANQMSITEYTPRKIKQAITGNGNASKEQVAAFVQSILNLPKAPESFDATDALAAAMCHFYQLNSPVSGKGFSSWKDFINKNPGRLK